MRILAIDPGYERLGIAIIDKEKNSKEVLVFSTCFQTVKDLPHSTRLGQIKEEIETILTKYSPEVLAIETLFFSKNQKTALKVAEARGTVIATAASHGLEVCELSPADIKIAVTGYGKSDKEHVIAMVPKLITLSKKITYDDEYDAIAAGLTFFALHHFFTIS